MEILFIVFLFGVVYTYFGYPLLLIVMTNGKKEIDSDSPYSIATSLRDQLPTVSLIISAHNEEAVIEDKVKNSLAIDYPRELLEIIVVSDGSTDSTPAIVRRFSDQGVKMVEIREHRGKTAGQNEAVRHSKGEILVFTDANSMFEPGAVKELIAAFTGERVGCVCGELRYLNSGASSVGKSESMYWKYEQFCKKRESLLGSLVGVNGAIYSIRRESFVDLNPDIISDFILPMEIFSRGWEVRYCSRAVAYEDTSQSFGDEFRRKKRIIVRSLHGLLRNPRFLNPFKKKSPLRHEDSKEKPSSVISSCLRSFVAMLPLSFEFLAVEIWSHKLIRWFVPVLLLGMLVSNMLLIGHTVFRSIFIVQTVFYLLALIGMVGGERARSWSVIYIPYYFLIINLAALKAILEFVMGERYDTWTTVR